MSTNTARRESITYPNGRVVTLGYGAADSIDDLFSLVQSVAIQGESGHKVAYARTGLGRYVSITYPQPALQMSMLRPGGGSEGDAGDPYDCYDRFGRVQDMRWEKTSGSSIIDGWQWGYDRASNRTWKKNLVAPSSQDEAYRYDGLYQVLGDALGTLNTNRTAIGGVPGEAEAFRYDSTGNWLGFRKDEDGAVALDQTRANNQDNQLTQLDGSSALLAYDRAGNATKTVPGTDGDWSKGFQPVWDAWNRIVEVKDENGATIQQNAYDGLTRRITRKTGGEVIHTYWSDRWKPLEERIDADTTAARQYLWGERPGHRDELVLRDRDTDGNGTLDERLYATMDYFNGTAMLDTSGAVQERYAYSAFGVLRVMAADFTPKTGSDYDWEFGFQGQFRDEETGWLNYGYRFYVPELGRWINRDLIEEIGGKNLFALNPNDGLNYHDHLGLAEQDYSCCDDRTIQTGRDELEKRYKEALEQFRRRNILPGGSGIRSCKNTSLAVINSFLPYPKCWTCELEAADRMPYGFGGDHQVVLCFATKKDGTKGKEVSFDFWSGNQTGEDPKNFRSKWNYPKPTDATVPPIGEDCKHTIPKTKMDSMMKSRWDQMEEMRRPIGKPIGKHK